MIQHELIFPARRPSLRRFACIVALGLAAASAGACRSHSSAQELSTRSDASRAKAAATPGPLSWAWDAADESWWRQGEPALPIRTWGTLPTDHLATRELREHLAGLTGLTWRSAEPLRPRDTLVHGLVLALADDQPPVAPLPTAAESYRLIRQAGGPVWIIGADDRGLLYGLYDLLEGWGVRWFQPGEVGTHLPQLDRLPLPRDLDRAGQPAFADRGYHITGSGLTRDGQPMGHYDDQTLVWMLRNRMNFKPIHNTQADDVLPLLEELYIKALPFGHSYSGWIPPEEFAQHPEWFALVGEQRLPGGQLCLSNPELRQALVERIVAFLDRHPTLPYVSLSPNDGYKFCQCENCLAMDTPEDRAAKELNRRHHLFTAAIAREVARRRPGAQVSSISYSNYLHPADDVPAEPALVISCTIRASLSHAINDPASPRNQAVWERIQRWTEKAGGVYFSEYYLSYGGLYPRPYHTATVQTLRALHQAGVRGVRSEVSPGYKPRWQSSVLHMYLVTRYAWDTGQDLDTFLDDFYTLYYGPAAADARLIHGIYQQAVQRYDGEIEAMGARLLPDLFTDDNVQQLIAASHRAAAQAREAGWPYTERVGFLHDQCALIEQSRREVIAALQEPTEAAVPRMSEFGAEAGELPALRQRETLLPMEPATRLQLGWNEEALLIDFHIDERLDPAMPGSGSGKVWPESHIDFFLCPDPDSGVYYQIAIDWQGDQYVARCQGREWNSAYPLQFEKELRVEEEGWGLRLRIPYASLETTAPAPGAVWRGGFNVGVRNATSSLYAGWPGGAAFHQIDRFGTLRFE